MWRGARFGRKSRDTKFLVAAGQYLEVEAGKLGKIIFIIFFRFWEIFGVLLYQCGVRGRGAAGGV